MTFRSRSAVIILLLVLLPACSSTTFFYNRLDFIIPWYMGKYVKLDRAQKNELDTLLAPFLDWHRSEELPSYLVLLDSAERVLDDEVTAAQLAALVDDAEAAWARTEARTLQWMLVVGDGLSDAQMAEFLESLREQQAEYEEEYLSRSDAEYAQEAYENLLDSMQDYLGRLDWGQRATLESAAASLQRADAVWLRERAGWLDRMSVILEREPGWQQALLDALDQREATTSPEYTAVYDHNVALIFSAVAKVLSTRSERQDKRLRGKIEDLRDDLETLIAQSRG